MTTVYRIEKRQYVNDWPSRGALFTKGRWNHKGFWIIYTSASISLAKLEILANSVFLPRKRMLQKIRIADKAPIKSIQIHELPVNWKTIPYPVILAEMAEERLSSGKYVGLKVPSCQSEEEYNFLLYPFFPKFNELVHLHDSVEIGFDQRLKTSVK